MARSDEEHQKDYGLESTTDTYVEEETQTGVREVEAAQKVWTKKPRIFLFIGLALASYVYSLDNYTFYTWTFRVTSSFGQHSLLTAITTAQAIIIAIGKIAIAKIADVVGRPQSFAICLAFYVVGYIIIASAQSINAYAGGVIIYSFGYTGLQIAIQIVIADVTTLRYRALTNGLFSVPFFINFAVGSKVAAHFAPTITTTTTPEYTTLLRWGFGMFTIIFPVALAPIIGTLWWGARKAKQMGYLTKAKVPGRTIGQKILNFFSEIDIIGMLLLLAGLALILQPTALAGRSFDPLISWSDAGILAPCYVIGALCWPALFFYDAKFAKHPIFPPRIFLNRSVVGTCIINFFDFFSFYMAWPYLSSFIAVTTDWTATNQNYFLNTQTLALTFFGILFGVSVVFTRRYKWVVFGGVCIRIIGVGTMIAARSSPGNTAGLVLTQIVQGLGGGIAAVGGQLATQASVPHQDVAVATAVFLLFAEIGNAVGNAVAGALWRARMPDVLNRNLAGLLPQADIDLIYGSAVTAATYPFGSEIRNRIIDSYIEVMHTLLVVATCVGVPALIGALMLHNYKATDTQNAVEAKDVSGNLVHMDQGNAEVKRKSFMSRFMKDAPPSEKTYSPTEKEARLQ